MTIDGRIYSLALALVALNGVDLVLTNTILHAGLGHEANPIMAYVVQTLWLFVVVKIGYPALVGWRYVRRARRPRPGRWLLPSMWIAVAVMTAVCLWNLRVLAVRS